MAGNGHGAQPHLPSQAPQGRGGTAPGVLLCQGVRDMLQGCQRRLELLHSTTDVQCFC